MFLTKIRSPWNILKFPKASEGMGIKDEYIWWLQVAPVGDNKTNIKKTVIYV